MEQELKGGLREVPEEEPKPLPLKTPLPHRESLVPGEEEETVLVTGTTGDIKDILHTTPSILGPSGPKFKFETVHDRYTGPVPCVTRYGVKGVDLSLT